MNKGRAEAALVWSSLAATTKASLSAVNTASDARTAYVLLVETTNGHYRRRVLLSVAAAENAVERARRRGMAARVTLCRLVPVDGGP